MIQTTIKATNEDIEKMKQTLLKFGDVEKVDVIVKSLHECQGLYLSALVHLSKAYVLYQPTTVKYFKENKIANFWATTASSLYDSGVMYLCGLLDQDSKINHKNLRKLIRNIEQLKEKPQDTPALSQQAEKIYKRLKEYRDKRLAHYEYSKEVPYYWNDPFILMSLVHKYIVGFHSAFLDTDFLLDTLRKEAENESASVCKSIGIPDLADQVKKEVVSFFSKVEAKIEW